MSNLDRRSSFQLRTYVVGSVLPMCRNKQTSVKIQAGLAALLSSAGPDPKTLAMLGCEGLALRAVSWKTSSSLAMHNSILGLAQTEQRYATMDPHLGCLRSAKFLCLIKKCLETEGISDVERSVLVGAVLSLVSQTPQHASIASGIWEERTVDLLQETLHLDGVMVIAIPEQDKAILLEKIQNTRLLEAIAAETDVVKLNELNTTLKANKRGWLDPGDIQRALSLIGSSVLLLTGIRHIGAEKDNLLMDPDTCDVSCTHDVSRRNAVVRGLASGTTLDVSLDMFTLHLGVLMAATLRVLAKYSEPPQDRDTIMRSVIDELPMFGQQPYLSKTKKNISPGPPSAPAAAVPPSATTTEDCRFTRLADELAAFKVNCDARIKVLERHRCRSRSRSRSPLRLHSPNSQAKKDGFA